MSSELVISRLEVTAGIDMPRGSHVGIESDLHVRAQL